MHAPGRGAKGVSLNSTLVLVALIVGVPIAVGGGFYVAACWWRPGIHVMPLIWAAAALALCLLDAGIAALGLVSPRFIRGLLVVALGPALWFIAWLVGQRILAAREEITPHTSDKVGG